MRLALEDWLAGPDEPGGTNPWGRLESPDCSGSWGGLFEAPARSQAGQAALKGLRAGLVSGLGVMEAFPRKQAR